MAVRGWGGSVATAIGVAAGAGAAQLGLGYGLGIIAWLPATDGKSDAAWVASLAWAVWIAATSTVAGAICADRIGFPRGARSADGASSGARTSLLAASLRRLALAVASALGGLATVVLVAVPARAATRADAVSPQTTAAGYAVVGVVIGVVVAIWALSSPAVANNVVATVGWLWLLAVVAVIDGVVSGRGVVGAQLGVWQITSDSDRFWFRDYFYWPGAALSLGSAALIGVLTARSAARRPAARVGAAVSGVVGPLLVAAAYFLATPQLVGIRAEQMSAHLVAPYAVIAGLAGSALVAAFAQRAEAAGRSAGIGAVPTASDGSSASGPGPDTEVSDVPAPDTEVSDVPAPDGSGPDGSTSRAPGRAPEQRAGRETGDDGTADTVAASENEPPPGDDGPDAHEPAATTAKGRVGRLGRRSR